MGFFMNEHSVPSKVMEYELNSLDTCLIFKTNEEIAIDKSPFTMAGGQELKVGDCFTSIGVRGSAGNPPLRLSEGWYQVYVGKVTVDAGNNWLTDDDRVVMLFESFEITSGINALHHYPNKKKYKYIYISYLEMTPYGQMMYWNSCNSSRVITCKEIERYNPNQGTNLPL